MAKHYVSITGMTIGDDSRSGDAFLITTEERDYWVPYSVCQKRHLTHCKGMDSIEVERWWADKNELESEPV